MLDVQESDHPSTDLDAMPSFHSDAFLNPEPNEFELPEEGGDRSVGAVASVPPSSRGSALLGSADVKEEEGGAEEEEKEGEEEVEIRTSEMESGPEVRVLSDSRSM